MPVYDIKHAQTGRIYSIKGDRPPTEQEFEELVRRAGGSPETIQEAQGLGEKAWDLTQKGLELAGRVMLDEALTGTVAGTISGMRQGRGFVPSLQEGLKRGVSATFEPVTGGVQDENWAQVLKEAGVPAVGPLGVVPGTGIPRALAGFGGDLFLSPGNLLGAGWIKPVAKAGLTAALGASRAAKAGKVLGTPERLWQAKVAQPLLQTGREAMAALSQGQFVPGFIKKVLPTDAVLRAMPLPGGEIGESVGDLKQTYQMKKRAARAAKRAESAAWVSKHQLTDPEQELLAYAQEYRQSPAAAQVAADPRLSAALTELNAVSDARYAEDVTLGRIPARVLVDVSDKIETLIQRLGKGTTPYLPVVEAALQGDTQALQMVQSNRRMKKVYDDVMNALQRADTSSGPMRGQLVQFGDPTTVKFEWVPPARGRKPVLAATVSSKHPGYISHAGMAANPMTEMGVTLSRGVRTALSEAKKRRSTLAELAEQTGTTPQAANLMLRRELSSVGVQADTDFLTEVAQRVGTQTPNPNVRKLKRELVREMPTPLQAIYKTTHLPNALADEIEKTTAKLTSPEHIEQLYHVIPRLIKTAQTTYNFPAHQAGNLMGNISNMATEPGMSVADAGVAYLRGLNLLFNPKAKVRPITVRIPATVQAVGGAPTTIRQVTLRTRDEILNFAKQYSILGETSAEMAEAAKRTPGWGTGMFRGRYNPLSPDFVAAEKLRASNQRLAEDPARLGMFLWNLEQGRSAEAATTSVVRRLFDNYDLTDAEKGMLRDAIPYYTWMRKNIPLQLRTMIEQPRYVGQTKQFLQALSDLAEGGDEQPARYQGPMREYLQTPDVFQLPRTPLTVDAEGNPILGRLRLPFFDLRLLTPTAKSARQQVSERMSPILRTGIERWLLGRDIERGIPIDDRLVKAGPAARALGAVGIGPGIGTGPRGPITTRSFEHWTRALPVPFGSVMRSLPAEGDQETMSLPQEILLRSTGLSPTPLTPALKQQALQDQVRKMRELQRAAQQRERVRRALGQ